MNKVSTKVELRFSVVASALLWADEKEIILKKLENRINRDGELVLVSQSARSQPGNREKVVGKFYALLRKALTPQKKRKPTRQTAASRERRLQSKRLNSEKKGRRKSMGGTE